VITTRRYTNPRLPLPYLTSMFHRSGIVADRSFTLREYIFWTVFAAVILTRWPSYTNLTPYSVCKYELPTSSLSNVIVWQTDRYDRN